MAPRRPFKPGRPDGRLARASRRLRRRVPPSLPVRSLGEGAGTDVDAYWAERTVRADGFASARKSEQQLEWRFDQYPLFREFSGLWGEHDGETILDYGCGPGNDLTGFALYTGATRVIGLDVSLRALSLAGEPLALHGISAERVELVQLSDSEHGDPARGRRRRLHQLPGSSSPHQRAGGDPGRVHAGTAVRG